MGFFSRELTADECAVIVRRDKEPQLIRGPGAVKTFPNPKSVVVVDLRPFQVEAGIENVMASDGKAVAMHASAEGQVSDPVAAAVKVVDFKRATQQILETAIRAGIAARPSSEVTSEAMQSDVADEIGAVVAGWGVVMSQLDLRAT